MGFNPCSYGSFVLTINMAKLCLRLFVSILVLMDLSFLQEVASKKEDVKEESFNPCSYGSFVLTVSLIDIGSV